MIRNIGPWQCIASSTCDWWLLSYIQLFDILGSIPLSDIIMIYVVFILFHCMQLLAFMYSPFHCLCVHLQKHRLSPGSRWSDARRRVGVTFALDCFILFYCTRLHTKTWSFVLRIIV